MPRLMCLLVLALLLNVHMAAARQITVAPGQSIQAAVDEALPGDVVRVLPGIYSEAGRPCPARPEKTCAVVVSRDDITLFAVPLPGRPVVLDSVPGQEQGIAFAKAGAGEGDCLADASLRMKGAGIRGFVVRNFEGTGVFLFCVDDWTAASNTFEDDQEYGIFALKSGPGRMQHNVAFGSHDTGFYIGQSHDVQIDHNVAHDNVAGFELESSIKVHADHNEAFANTAGMLMFIAPDADVLSSQGNRIADNDVHDNNSANSCLDPSDEVCLVPPGVGILSAGGMENVIAHNRVEGNDTFGIALVDICSAFQIDPAHCTPATLGFDPLPQSTRIEFNAARDNGNSPQGGFPGADLVWTGNGDANCWDHNKAGTTFPSSLPVCSAGGGSTLAIK